MTTFRRWNNNLKTLALLGALSALLVGVGGVLAPGRLELFLVLALAMNLASYWWSDKLVLRMHGAREVGPADAPALHDMVRALAVRAELPMPRVFVIDDPSPNAFATGRSPHHAAVAVTTGIMRLLTPRELRGVMAHELAHVKNRDTLVSTIAAALASAISYAAQALSFGAMFGRSDEESRSPAGALLVMLVAPIAALLIQMGVSRSREYLADEEGARIAGDPIALADALGRMETRVEELPTTAVPATASLYIINPFTGAGGLARLFSTHPETAERIRRLHAMAGRA